MPISGCPYQKFGSVAKIGWGRKKSGPDFSLGSDIEEALHESHLFANVAFPDSFHLSLFDHVHGFIAADCPMRRGETGKPESGIDSSLYKSVVLFEDIIEVFALPELRGHS